MPETRAKSRIWWAALLTAVSVTALVALGNVVTATGSGMGCGDDWPHCNGTWIPVFFNHMVVLEYAHRLLAGVVVLFTLALGAATYRAPDPVRRRFRGPVTVALILLSVEVGLGAVTVVFELPRGAVIAHLGVSMLFFAALAVVIGRLACEPTSPEVKGGPGVVPVLYLATVLVFLQILAGAYVRHIGAGPSCGSLPLCFGAWWPANDPAAMAHMVHRFAGVAVAVALVGSHLVTIRSRPDLSRWTGVALGLGGLQVVFGGVVVAAQSAILSTTLHLLGAMVLLSVLVLGCERAGVDMTAGLRRDRFAAGL